MTVKFMSLASGSSGNCYYLATDNTAILVDAGIGIRTIKKVFKERMLNLEGIQAVLVTHDHADHIKAVGHLGEKHGIPVYTTPEIHEGMKHSYCMTERLSPERTRFIRKEETFSVGDFTITCFEVPLDGTDNVGYCITAGDKTFSFFDRVELHLGKTDQAIAALPTDEQLLQYTDKSQRNPELEALYFQYGRYLLISSSRTPGVPANLQGLWNERLLPPWSCNYTSNINLEENYWAAETANLSEMHRPLMDFIANLQHTGEESAKAYYGVQKGWCLGQNTDIWAMTCPVGLNVGDPSWACWTMGVFSSRRRHTR